MALSIKDPEEKVNVTFDYSSQYTSIKPSPPPVVTITLKGEDVDIPSMKASLPIILPPPNNNKVVITVQGGEDGQQYDIRCVATTNTDEVIVVKDVLTVKKL